jgi:hypothetical protein
LDGTFSSLLKVSRAPNLRVGFVTGGVAAKLLVQPLDLIDAYHLLLCVLDLLVVHMPDRLRRSPLPIAAEGGDASDTLARLCQTQDVTSLADVRRVRQKLFNPLVLTLRDGRILAYQPARLPPHAALAGSLYLGGLLDDHLLANEQAIAKEYDMLVARGPGVHFDERLFVEQPDQLGVAVRY